MSDIHETITKLKSQVADLENSLAISNGALRERDATIATLRHDLARYDQGMHAVDARARAVMKTAGFGAGGTIGKPTDIIDFLDLFLDALTNKRIQAGDHVPRDEYNKEKNRADALESTLRESNEALIHSRDQVLCKERIVGDYKASYALMEKRALVALTDAGIDHPFSITKQTVILDSIQELGRKISNMAAEKYRAVQYHELMNALILEVQAASKLSGVHIVNGPTPGNTVMNMLHDLSAECHKLYVQARKADEVRVALAASKERITELERQTFNNYAKNCALMGELEYERKGWGKLSNELFGDEVHTLDDAIGMFRDLCNNCDKVYRANVKLVAHGFEHKADHLIKLAQEFKQSAETLKTL